CGSFDLSGDPAFGKAADHFGFRSGKSTHADRLQTIRDAWHRFSALIDPHTADGVKVAREHSVSDVPMIVLETALPVKFAETIREALGREPVPPQRFDGIEGLPRRFKLLPADAQTVKTYITETLQAAVC
ncbi:MAG: threonine synthase, partial [Mesorhizobium sp.]